MRDTIVKLHVPKPIIYLLMKVHNTKKSQKIYINSIQFDSLYIIFFFMFVDSEVKKKTLNKKFSTKLLIMPKGILFTALFTLFH
jgi:hypothetical protein